MNFPGRPSVVHTYRSLSVAGGWNLFRVARLTLNQSIVDYVGWILSSIPLVHNPFEPLLLQVEDPRSFQAVQRQLRKSQHTITIMIDGIFASVYSHLQISIDGKPNPDTSRDVPAIRGMLLLWPLHAAVNAMANNAAKSNADEVQRSIWLKRLLNFISYDLNIAQAGSIV